MKDVVLFGIRGAWKWTQATNILNHYKQQYLHFDPGAILRALKSWENCLSEYIKKTYDRWELLDDSFLMSLFDAYCVALDYSQNMLIDWFPRKWGQTHMFLDRMKRMKRNYVSILLDLPEEESIKRQSSRRVCQKCGSIYNVILDWEMQRCAKCDWEIIQRIDDQPEMIKKRLNVYYDEIYPIIKYFDELWVFVKVDANRPKQEIFDDIKHIIEN